MMLPLPPRSTSAPRRSPSSSALGSSVSATACIWVIRCSPSHGLAVNCTRWVSSCRHTHSRKSVGSAPISRSTWTMLGATSSSRPYGSWNGSNCPSTLLLRKPSIRPTSAPVTRVPTASANADGGPFFSMSLSTTGLRSLAKPSALARSQPLRSTTSTGAVPASVCSPVNSRTSGVERVAPSRSSTTAAAASSGDTSGPGPATRVPTVTAKSQSTRFMS